MGSCHSEINSSLVADHRDLDIPGPLTLLIKLYLI
jgi:hypothetical protein